MDSPNQHPGIHVDDLRNNPSRKDGDQIVVGDLSLEIRADQRNATIDDHNVGSDNAPTHDENSSKNATPTAKIQTTGMTLSQEEFDQLEKANPLAAFDLMLKNGVLFSKSIGGSSNTSTDDPSETLRDNFLAEFRSEVLEMDLFQAIEQDASIIPEIKELLRKLRKPPFGTKFQEFSQTLEPLMEDINLSFHQRKADQSKLDDQTVRCNQLMAEITTFQEKYVTFRHEVPNAKQKVKDLNSAIAKHEEEIRLLKLQIANVQEKEDLMQKEANIALQKIRESHTSQQEMVTLVENGKILDERLADFKGKLNKLKSEFAI